MCVCVCVCVCVCERGRERERKRGREREGERERERERWEAEGGMDRRVEKYPGVSVCVSVCVSAKQLLDITRNGTVTFLCKHSDYTVVERC